MKAGTSWPKPISAGPSSRSRRDVAAALAASVRSARLGPRRVDGVAVRLGLAARGFAGGVTYGDRVGRHRH